MKQYCRYCGFCSEVDGGYYCGEKERLMSEDQIKRANNCDEYAYTTAGDVITPGRQYKPRREVSRHTGYMPQQLEIQ